MSGDSFDLHQPKLAELVSAALRERILAGEWADDSPLPTRDELRRWFPVSPPALREALVILETEGLVASPPERSRPVRVRRPREDVAAYALSLLLQARQAPLADVAEAVEQLEPLCVAISAERADRHATFLPELRQLHEQALDSLDDPAASFVLGRRFHSRIVAGCGNRTLSFLVAVLRAMWHAHREPDGDGWAPPISDRAEREAAITTHAAVIDRLDAGDARGARLLARQHIRLTHRCGRAVAVRASTVRPLTRTRTFYPSDSDKEPW